jgi:hypothetical protein
VAPARWALSLPSVRIRLDRPPSPGTVAIDGDLGQAAFLPGAGRLLLGFGGRSTPVRLQLFDAALATLRPVSAPADFDGLAVLATARNAPVAAIGSFNGEWLFVRLDEAALTGREPLQPTFLSRVAEIFSKPRAPGHEPPPAALDPSGRFLFVASHGRREVLRCDLSLPDESPKVWYCAAPVTALTCTDNHVLIGLDDGSVHRQTLDAEGPSTDSLANVGGAPVALALLQTGMADEPAGVDVMRLGDGELLIVGRQDGTLLVHDGEHASSEFDLGGAPRRVVGLQEPAMALVRRTGERAEHDPKSSVTVAVLRRDGVFDIVGVPTGDGRSSFTPMSLLDRPLGAVDVRRHEIGIAGQSRRVAVVAPDPVSGGKRLEVRPFVLRTSATKAAADEEDKSRGSPPERGPETPEPMWAPT